MADDLNFSQMFSSATLPTLHVQSAVRVKICGVTTVQDAEHAAFCGADAIGLVFAESPRRVSIETAAAIVQALPPFVTPIGLFVDAEARVVRETCEAVGLRSVQLHGREPPTVLHELLGFTVVKAFRIADAATISGVRQWLSRAPYWPAGLLFDAYTPKRAGGTGERFDWNLVPPREVRGDRPALILAGGLNPENVSEAIRQTQVYAVDVSSGVESSPGVKDPAKTAAFIANAKAAR